MSNSEQDSFCSRSEQRCESNENKTDSPDEKYDPLYFCRTCANKDSFFVSIFKEEGLSHQLHQKIEKYLPIHITKDDDLPLQLCYNCASTIIAWDALIVGCIEAEKKLISLRNIIHNDDSEHDGNVDKQNESPNELDEAVANNVDSDDEPLITKKLSIIKNSRKRRNSKKQVSEGKSETSDSHQENENEADREKTNHRVENVPDKLLEVAQPFANQEEYESGTEWSPDRTWTEVSLPKSQVRNSSQKDKRVFQCNICSKVLNRKFNFERHLLVHSGETLTCHACGKQYRGQSVLDRHIKVIHQQSRVPSMNCDYCGKGFSSRQSLEDHFRTHTGERPYICEICGKDFRARPNLIAHKKIHSGNLPFACNLCDYKCRLKGTFIDHCQRHEGKRTCLCSVCGKGFVNNYDLSKHKKTHSKDRIFSCTSCNLTFVMKRYLKVHMKTHVQKSEIEAATFKSSFS